MPSGCYSDPHLLKDQADRIKQEYLALFFLVLALALFNTLQPLRSI
jgi:hypothetical protein